MASLGRTAEAQDLLEDALDVEPENVQAARLLASLEE
jgi:cytochrome c-type biogenesis protein CcmH/NrfG